MEDRRFWSKVDCRGPDDCWEWQGPIAGNDYGYYKAPSGQSVRAHRYAYTLAYGPIPAGEGFHGTVVMHTCDNRLCCNPAHLVLGTQAENLADMRRKGRGYPPPANEHLVGEDAPQAKLTWNEVAEIRTRYKGPGRGPTQRELAAEYGVDQSTISDIVNYRSYREEVRNVPAAR